MMQIKYKEISIEFPPLAQPSCFFEVFQDHDYPNIACHVVYLSSNIDGHAEVFYVFKK